MKTWMKTSLGALALGFVLTAPLSARAEYYYGPPRPVYRPYYYYEPQNIIDFNPVALLWGRLSFEYEHAFAPGMSFLVGPQITLYNGVELSPQGTPVPGILGFGITGALHFFPGGHALHGFWLGPELDLGFDANAQPYYPTGWYYGAYCIFGYTWLPAPHFNISLGIGPGWAYPHGLFNVYPGFDLTGRLALGYAW